jgi:ABC-type nitrate/sulfonate/bicarbonate transport system substrate-binding protein
MKSFRLFGAAMMAAAFAFAPATVLHAQTTVTMGSVGSASASLWPLYIGLNNGFFDAEGIKIDVMFAQSNAAVIQQLAAGSIDLGINCGLVDPIRAIDKGAPAAVVRLEISPPPYVLLGKPTIASVADLKGKIVTVGGAKDITRILTDRVLMANGVEPASVDYSFAGSTSARLSALKSGAVDGAIVLPPFNFYGERAGFKPLALISDVVKDMPFAGMVANTKWAAGNETTIKKVLAVYDRSVAWFYDPANREKAVNIMVSVSKGNKEDVEKTYDFMQKGRFYVETSAISQSKLNNVVKVLVELGDLEKSVPVEKLVLPGAKLED